MRPTQAIIHLSALKHNLSVVKTLAPDSRIMAVVKADAYGHGIVPAARAFSDVDALAVACIEEAMTLREGGIEKPIILLEGFFDSCELELIHRYALQLVIHHQAQIETLNAYLEKLQGEVKPLDLWLKLDSEMNRLGFEQNDFMAAYQQLTSLPHIGSIRLMTHLACADDIHHKKTPYQIQLFKKCIHGLTEEQSIANSAGVLAWPESHADWIRPGLLLYGCSPLPDCQGSSHNLKAAMNLESALIAKKPLKKGQTVGYGAMSQSEKDTMLGIVAIGYGDGYPRQAEIGTPVWINNRLVPLLGHVSMDMIAVDLGSDANDEIGDRVVLWGKELPVEVIARHANTIPYTLLCGVTSRVTFQWIEPNSSDGLN